MNLDAQSSWIVVFFIVSNDESRLNVPFQIAQFLSSFAPSSFYLYFRYNDFVELLRRTRSAFCMAPGGMARFNDILDMIRKSYPKKGELWQKIMTGLSTA